MEIEIDSHGWPFDWDSFGTEASAFERDVYMLILTGLDAGLKLLNTETQAEDDKLMQYLPKAKGDATEHLAQEQADMWIQLFQQEAFLRNMALVALMSRLMHALLSMLRHAEPWAPLDSDAYAGQDEFKKIWADFRARFGLNLSARYIGWIEPYRRARNRIVHNGGEANPMKPFEDIDIDSGDEGMYDMSFSKKYCAFVSGSGFSAEVVVTEKLLDHAVKCAIRLVKHAAEELRRLELEYKDVSASSGSLPQIRLLTRSRLMRTNPGSVSALVARNSAGSQIIVHAENAARTLRLSSLLCNVASSCSDL